MTASIPELLISAGSLEQMQRFIQAGASAVLIGEAKFGMRLPGDIKANQLKEAVKLAHQLGAKAYVNMNRLFRNDELADIPDYLKVVQDAGADAIVFGDPAVLMNVRQYTPQLKMQWNAEMTGTNSATSAYWGRRGAVRAIIARELNEDEIIDLRSQIEMELQVQVHGMTNIYHSHRNLLQSYMEHLGKEARLIRKGADNGLFLVETERPDEKFPVYEDDNGTHVMSPDDICLLEALPELIKANVDSFYIEPLLKSDEYNVTVLNSYRSALDAWQRDSSQYQLDDQWLHQIQLLQNPDRELGFGFLYKEQVY
ncbi:MAG: U32 family peptidase [Candidatus Cohnella colombiensis]|uniref:U32 family peptidase n=1 Tax=Candidatus Cohnella colombiensis TaxID=3121368 RepID=A0AA95EWC7_9BACL|nr:MAG: U32 family peptidase [Cohnella sp.]